MKIYTDYAEYLKNQDGIYHSPELAEKVEASRALNQAIREDIENNWGPL